MNQRIEVELPTETIELLDAAGGDRDRTIDRAIRNLVGSANRRATRAALKEGYLLRAKESRRMAEEWRPLEEEVVI